MFFNLFPLQINLMNLGPNWLFLTLRVSDWQWKSHLDRILKRSKTHLPNCRRRQQILIDSVPFLEYIISLKQNIWNCPSSWQVCAKMTLDCNLSMQLKSNWWGMWWLRATCSNIIRTKVSRNSVLYTNMLHNCDQWKMLRIIFYKKNET